MKSFLSFITEDEDYIRDISHFKPIGDRRGTNPGGLFQDPHSGEKHYVKFNRDSEQSRHEVAASGIYKMMKIPHTESELVKHEGKIGVASKWNDDIEQQHPTTFSNLSDSHKHELAKHFMGAVLTKNWDAVGFEHDNLMKNKYTDEYHAVDLGGTFEHRAQGSHKPYGPDIGEYHTLRDRNMNPQNAGVFNQLGPEHLATGKAAMHDITHEKVHTLFSNLGLDRAADKAANLMARKDALLEASSSKL